MTDGDTTSATTDRSYDVHDGLEMPLREAIETQRAIRPLLPDPVDLDRFDNQPGRTGATTAADPAADDAAGAADEDGDG